MYRKIIGIYTENLFGKSFSETRLKNNFDITISNGDFGGIPSGNGIVKLIK